MVSQQAVEQQLKQLHFNAGRWGRAEVRELPHVLIPDEQIYECANGFYEGGFALLVATDLRVLLIDKKPLNYLTVEDLRFDMINEIDYSHRMMGAQITISTGSKTLRFRSYNQRRLRKLITHVQHCMAQSKQQQSQHQAGQNQHLEQINQQLQAYLVAQYQNQQALTEQLQQAQRGALTATPEPHLIQPSPELSDYLFAQSLLRQHQEQSSIPPIMPSDTPGTPQIVNIPASPQLSELYADGMQEVFGKHQQRTAQTIQGESQLPLTSPADPEHRGLEINSLRIAYSKLPMALRNRKFGFPTARIPNPPPLSPVTPRPAEF